MMMNNTVMGVVMILAGLALFSGGIAVMTRKQSAPVAAPLTREEKGVAFEKFIVAKFRKRFFIIKEWRSDKYQSGAYAESSRNPDLEIELHTSDISKLFAVECKWRKDFDKGVKPGIEWATEEQIRNYNNYAQSKNIPMFVAIGIGGEPDSPRDLFIVSLNGLKYPYATAEYLENYRRNNKDHHFYFDWEKPELR